MFVCGGGGAGAGREGEGGAAGRTRVDRIGANALHTYKPKLLVDSALISQKTAQKHVKKEDSTLPVRPMSDLSTDHHHHHHHHRTYPSVKLQWVM